jgi:hypothetical protein
VAIKYAEQTSVKQNENESLGGEHLKVETEGKLFVCQELSAVINFRQ